MRIFFYGLAVLILLLSVIVFGAAALFQVYFFPAFDPFKYALVGVPLAVFMLLFVVHSHTKLQTVIKWVTSISLFLSMAPFVMTWLLCLGSSSGSACVAFGLIFLPLLFIVIPIMFIGALILLTIDLQVKLSRS